VKLLLCKNRYCNFEREDITGREPLNLLPMTSKRVSSVRLFSEAGKEPDKPILPICIAVTRPPKHCTWDQVQGSDDGDHFKVAEVMEYARSCMVAASSARV
jgi:hypothetical protein